MTFWSDWLFCGWNRTVREDGRSLKNEWEEKNIKMYTIINVNYPFRYALYTIRIRAKCKDIIQFMHSECFCISCIQKIYRFYGPVRVLPVDQLSWSEEDRFPFEEIKFQKTTRQLISTCLLCLSVVLFAQNLHNLMGLQIYRWELVCFHFIQFSGTK